MNEFVTLAYMLSLPGMILIVIGFTYLTKTLWDKLFFNRTSHVVYAYSLLFCVFGLLMKGNFVSLKDVIASCFIWLANSVVVWLAARKAYEEVSERMAIKK